ncbi:NERD domain-containing protein [Nocardia barduliensis]|uniref:NERD domain-containing protein n=1 Tax=Nocardia barduliensis TaxID=2736643 RepID=UPI001574538E|nr:NERD domain-containing protein [Nocardia barduliensis]
MLVINERTTAPRSEQRVLGWMRNWTGQYVIVGLAISGCYLPDRERKGEAREADLVVITPRAAVVIEVRDTVPEATAGVLSVQANGRWRLSGFAGDPIQVHDHDGSPFDQLSDNVVNLQALVRKHHAEASVDGLIVVVPPEESALTLHIESRRRGCAVVLGASAVDLRAWFHRTASRKLVWTAERTHALLADLNLGDQVTIDDLVADGFPPERKLRAGTLAALESVTRKVPELEDRTSAEDSDTDDVSTGSDAPVPNAVPEPPNVARRTASDSTRTPESGDEAAPQFPEADQPTAVLSAMPTPKRTDASEPGIEEREGSASVQSTPSGAGSAPRADRLPTTAARPLAAPDGSQDVPAFESAAPQAPIAGSEQTQPAEADPFAPEFLAPEPISEPASSADTTARSSAREEERPSAASGADARPLEPGVPENDHPEPPRFEGRLAARSASEDLAEPYSYATERFATGYVASIRPVAAESTTPERTEPELPPADEEFDPAARSASAPSSFTDSWSSWIEPAPDRPLRPRPAQAPQQAQPTAWSTPTPDPEPLRRPVPTAVLERPRIAVREQITALSARIPGRTAEKSKPGGHRSQQIAAVALIVLVIGMLWILAASCSTPTGGAVQPSQAPVPTTEADAPPPAVTQTPGRMNLLPLCTPLTPKC